MVSERCRSCLYYTSRDGICNYILITSHSRGCHAGDDCDKYVLNKEGKLLSDYYSGRAVLTATDQEILHLYEKGLNDFQIGQITGKGMLVIANWRRKMGLPSQREIEARCHED